MEEKESTPATNAAETVALRCPKCRATSVVTKAQAARELNCTDCLLENAQVVKLVEARS